MAPPKKAPKRDEVLQSEAGGKLYLGLSSIVDGFRYIAEYIDSNLPPPSTAKKPKQTRVKGTNPYILYQETVRPTLAAEMPDLQQKHVMTVLAAKWKALPPEEKQVYVDRANATRAEAGIPPLKEKTAASEVAKAKKGKGKLEEVKAEAASDDDEDEDEEEEASEEQEDEEASDDDEEEQPLPPAKKSKKTALPSSTVATPVAAKIPQDLATPTPKASAKASAVTPTPPAAKKKNDNATPVANGKAGPATPTPKRKAEEDPAAVSDKKKKKKKSKGGEEEAVTPKVNGSEKSGKGKKKNGKA
ncbi:hypothetical protein HK097_005655 [Rhizophlyctis rosea]|uniref:HMG box domain-containing protein n=1 Tax=Rhizophlyctis rosea TaxID=64517 RepID=A0AAD5SFC5_9FUNG|nr:hypothetical protein HK097_005655 [Rhizophlyctis rosea]